MKFLRHVTVMMVMSLSATQASAEQDRYCREYSTDFTIGGEVQKGYGTACLTPSGEWEIISQEHAVTFDNAQEERSVYRKDDAYHHEVPVKKTTHIYKEVHTAPSQAYVIGKFLGGLLSGGHSTYKERKHYAKKYEYGTSHYHHTKHRYYNEKHRHHHYGKKHVDHRYDKAHGHHKKHYRKHGYKEYYTYDYPHKSYTYSYSYRY